MQNSIRRQIEFYFGDKNYYRDGFLKGLAMQDPQRWVAIAEIIKFNKMSKLTTSAEEVILAI